MTASADPAAQLAARVEPAPDLVGRMASLRRALEGVCVELFETRRRLARTEAELVALRAEQIRAGSSSPAPMLDR